MKALQDAVPEDVRGKLMDAVSGVLHAEGTNLKLEGLLGIGKIPNVTSEVKAKVQQKVSGSSSAENQNKDSHRADQVKRIDDLADGSDNVQPGVDKPAGQLESELRTSENLQKSADVGQSQIMSSKQGDISSSARKGTNESGNNHENDVLNKEKAVPYSDIAEKGSENSTNSNFAGQPEKAGGAEEAIAKEDKVEQDGGVSRLEAKPESNQRIGEKTIDSSTDQNKTTSTAEEAVLTPGSFSEAPAMEREGNDNQKKEHKSFQPAVDQNKSTTPDPIPPTFSVSEALDALTGMDDSTQMAVNSVFGVIENMISQLEEGKDNENEVKERKEVKDGIPEKQILGSDHTPGNKEDGKNELSVHSHTSCDPPAYNSGHEISMDSHHDARTERVEEECTKKPTVFDGNGTNYFQKKTTAKHLDMEKKRELVGSKPFADFSNKLTYVNKIPLYVPVNLKGDAAENEYSRRYLLSKMPDTKPLDLDTTTALFLDYFPEEGQWKLLEQPGNVGDSIGDVTISKGVDGEVQSHSSAKVNDADKFIEPMYVILDTDKQQEPLGEYEMKDNMKENTDSMAESMSFVKNIILDSLKVEVERRLSPSDRREMESDLARDLEKVADAVSLAVVHDKEHSWCLDGKHDQINCISTKVGTLHGENTVRAISSAVQGTSFLRRVLPVGVLVGSTLAALRKYFNVSTELDNDHKDSMVYDPTNKSGELKHDQAQVTEIKQMPIDKNRLNGLINRERVGAESKSLNNDTVMVGAVTAALGASALLVKQSVRVSVVFFVFLF